MGQASGWNIEVMLLAAGVSSRMRGTDKLLRAVNGQPLLRHSAVEMVKARIGQVHVVVPSTATQRVAALAGLDVNLVTTAKHPVGMSASIAAGIAALSPRCDGVVIALADMPDVTSAHVRGLVQKFAPDQGAGICRSTTVDGQHGHPVLFAQRYFQRLSELKMDQGARGIMKEAVGDVQLIPFKGSAVITDLDTPEDWSRWELQQGQKTISI